MDTSRTYHYYITLLAVEFMTVLSHAKIVHCVGYIAFHLKKKEYRRDCVGYLLPNSTPPPNKKESFLHSARTVFDIDPKI